MMDAKEFKAKMAALPQPPSNAKPPQWDHWRFDLWTRAQEDEPQSFTRWPAVHHTMLVDHWKSIIASAEIQYVDDKAPKFRQTIQPWNTSDFLNYIHQAYHILRWQEATGLNIADMQSIYEFGGGYGAMALVCNRLGFKGEYYIYDLPEFALLQQWYLGECGVDNVRWMPGSLSKYGFYLHEVDLFIACYSLSETDFAERDEFLARIQANSFLFLYSNKFEQYDNIAYFQAEHSFPPVKNWQHEHIEHLPPESWYTWGW